ncbi:MAG: phospholipid scramblase-related protein [Nannocystaceae bacterium]
MHDYDDQNRDHHEPDHHEPDHHERHHDESHALVPLEESSGLVVEQMVEWHESFSSFETENRYLVHDEHGDTAFIAEEEPSGILSMITRNIMNTSRPFTMHIFSPTGEPVAVLRRPFRFYFHQLNVYDSDGGFVGTVRKRWSLLRRKYVLLDPDGKDVFEIVGPFFRPWTFDIFEDGEQVAQIRKSWSGFGRELLTDADTFGVEYETELAVHAKLMLLATVFLIDFVHFENRN